MGTRLVSSFGKRLPLRHASKVSRFFQKCWLSTWFLLTAWRPIRLFGQRPSSTAFIVGQLYLPDVANFVKAMKYYLSHSMSQEDMPNM